jgi:hypothetical protein
LGSDNSSALVREEVNEVSEVFEVKEANEVSEESPSGDFSPSVGFKTKTRSTKDKPPTTTLPTASVETELSTRGAAKPKHNGYSGRGNDISAGDFIEVAWSASEGI